MLKTVNFQEELLLITLAAIPAPASLGMATAVLQISLPAQSVETEERLTMKYVTLLELPGLMDVRLTAKLLLTGLVQFLSTQLILQTTTTPTAPMFPVETATEFSPARTVTTGITTMEMDVQLPVRSRPTGNAQTFSSQPEKDSLSARIKPFAEMERLTSPLKSVTTEP